MNGVDALQLVLAFVAGTLLGAVYFAGLWLADRHTSKAPLPFWLYGVSILLRLILLMGGFYLLAMRGTAMLLVGGIGFFTVRQLWLLGKRRPAKQPIKISVKICDGDE